MHLVDIDKLTFWSIENLVIKANYHLHVLGDLDMYADFFGKSYRTKNKELVLAWKREKNKILYVADKRLVDILSERVSKIN